MKVIYVMGPMGSGKDVAVEFFKENGFKAYRLRDIVLKETEARNLPLSRSNLQLVGNQLRELRGPDFLAKQIAEQIKNSNAKKVVVVGARNKKEPEFMQSEFSDLVLLYIETDSSLRRERILARQRTGDPQDVQELEKNIHTDSIGVEPCKSLPNVIVVKNNATIEEFLDKLTPYV